MKATGTELLQSAVPVPRYPRQPSSAVQRRVRSRALVLGHRHHAPLGEANARLAWRIENACIAAWPTKRERLIDGGLVRQFGGPVRRSNSATPTRDASWSEGVIARVDRRRRRDRGADLWRGHARSIDDRSRRHRSWHRQRGLAHACITTLMYWGKAAGAEATCLQVEATNASAVAFYRKLGYGDTVYRYHCRRAPRP